MVLQNKTSKADTAAIQMDEYINQCQQPAGAN
jgi:hypothetical protein